MTPAQYQSLLDIRRALGVNTDALPQACAKPVAVPVPSIADLQFLLSAGTVWDGDYRD
jgi:hypothetical protein